VSEGGGHEAPDRTLGSSPPRWLLRAPPPEADARSLATELGLPVPLARVLVQRGMGRAEDARRHLRPLIDELPRPGRLKDLAAAADRIADAIRMGEPVFVHGDYDVDGVCAAALLTRWIRRLGGIVHPFVPHRLRDGYDLSAAGVARARDAGARRAGRAAGSSAPFPRRRPPPSPTLRSSSPAYSLLTP